MKLYYESKDTKEVEIHLPIFRKEITVGGAIVKYGAVLSDETFISVLKIGDTTSVKHGPAARNNGDIAEMFATWETIDEEEFLKIHEETRQSLSLKPVLSEKNPDDISGVL